MVGCGMLTIPLFEADSSGMRLWKLFLIILVLFEAIVVPWQFLFFTAADYAHFHVTTFLIDTIFFVALIVNFNTKIVLPTGRELASRREISASYIKSTFTLDVLTALPFELIGYQVIGFEWAHVGIKVLSCMRLSRVSKIAQLTSSFFYFVYNYHALRISRFAIFVAIVSHWAACAFSLIVMSSKSELYTPSTKFSDRFRFYTNSLYWSLSTITTIGYAEVMSSPTIVYHSFACVLMPIGVGVFTYLIALIREEQLHRNQSTFEFSRKMEKLERWMMFRKVPTELRRQIREYSMLNQKMSILRDIGEKELLSELPRTLRDDITRSMHALLLSSTDNGGDQWSDSPLLVSLVQEFKTICVPPNEVVYRANEPDDRMFVVASGTAVKRYDDFSNFEEQLTAGSSFGAMSLLSLGVGLGFTIETTSWCELHVLDRHTMINTLHKYPKIRQEIVQEAGKRLVDHLSLSSSRSAALMKTYASLAFADNRFNDFKQREERADDIDQIALLKIIDRMSEGQAKAVLYTFDSMRIRFQIQQTLIASAATVLEKSSEEMDD